MSDNHQPEEIMVLSHTPWPGFKKAFLVILTASVIYLAVVLISSFSSLPAH